MHIRSANRNDFRNIASIHAASWKDTYRGILPNHYLLNQVSDDLSRHWSEMEVKRDDIVLVAESDRPIGFIAVWCRPQPLIDNLHVLPDVRSRGIGSHLMVTAVDTLLQRGYTQAHLWVMTKNVRAIDFYQRLGGARVRRAVRRVFGHDVPHFKILWEDLSVIKAINQKLLRKHGGT